MCFRGVFLDEGIIDGIKTRRGVYCRDGVGGGE